MDNSRTPKQLLCSELVCSRHDPKRHWRDQAVMDIRTLEINTKGDWYMRLHKADNNGQLFVNR